MADQDYEADLSVLEDMCSEFEESSILFDKDLKILWINKILKQKLKAYFANNELDLRLGDEGQIDYSLVKRLCIEMYGKEMFSENSIARNVFSTGKLAKSMTRGSRGIMKKISIPIKFGNDVAYVLEIIEEQSQSVAPELASVMKYFLAQRNAPCILADKPHHHLFHNKRFDLLFQNSGLLKELIEQKLRNNPKDGLKDLEELMYLSHSIKRIPLKDDGKLIAYVYELHKNSH